MNSFSKKTMDTSTLLGKILDSVFYNTSLKKASRISKNTVGILTLLKGVLGKIQAEGKSTVLATVKNKILTLGKLLKFYATGDYRNIDLKNVVIIITAFVYFLSPIDLIPDFIPMLGFADDIALVTFVFNSVAEEIEKFETWLLNRDIS
ncbi:DUF1232 domain-containing protein [Lacihabitans soyangensis]|uniref:DUF1232 domain-containing protein n=2 Tax=Lacihabitans soyangensis TaxID=869394 RepID=A0AAE3H0U7_9BACT|nr:DUF1232 domain-containing protein [Lacihabitans soyangensis]